MMTLCKTCGTAYDATPETCPICEDERQYVPHSGRAWIDFATVTSTHSNKWQQLAPQLFSIKTVPAFAINQRALLLRTRTAIFSGTVLPTSTRQPKRSLQRSAASARLRFRTHTITPPCRHGLRHLMRRCTCTPATESGSCAAVPPFSSGKGMRWNYSRRSPCCVWGTFCRRHGAALAGGRRRITGGDILQVTPGKTPFRLCGATRICCRCLPAPLSGLADFWKAKICPSVRCL